MIEYFGKQKAAQETNSKREHNCERLHIRETT